MSFRGPAAALLAVALALGATLSAVQASGMAVEMALSPHMNAASHDCCEPCPEGADASLAKSCMMACVAAGFAVLSDAARMTATPAATVAMPIGLASRGRAVPPEPVPPKSDRHV